MATSEQCPDCHARNWTIYRVGNRLIIRCGHCDALVYESALVDSSGRILTN